MKEKFFLSIIIPAYNEADTINTTLEKIKEVADNININYEIIVVNDGSTDATEDILKVTKYAHIITHPYNKGYGRAIKAGAEKTRGEFLLLMDADGQHDPNLIPGLVQYLDQYDMVVAARTTQSSYLRAPAKLVLGWFANYLADRKIPDLNSGFRIIKKDIFMKHEHLLPDSFSLSSTITMAMIKGGYDVKYVPTKAIKRQGGKSVLKPFKDTTRFILLLLRLTMLFSPFRVFLPISVFVFVVGLAYSIIDIILYFNIPDTAIFLMLAGMFFFFFGLLADQVAALRREIHKYRNSE